ncbi:MAG: hypothetical protein ACX931_02305 [Saccharospirillum sp.]
MFRVLSIILVASLTLSVFSAQAQTRQFYRYKDDDGQIVINSSIPPEFVRRGYEIVDDKGVVLREVAPQLSEEEITRRAEEAARAEAERARDTELMRLYRNPLDVDRAMRTWLSRLDMEISLKNNRISILRAEYNELQSQAANLERAGQDVDPQLLSAMADLEAQISALRDEITEIEQRQQAAETRFQVERERMEVLYERQQGRPWVEPDSNS